MGDIVSAIFGKQGPSEEEEAARRLQGAKSLELRRKEERENRRLASVAKTQTAIQRSGSLFPSDFAPGGSLDLG